MDITLQQLQKSSYKHILNLKHNILVLTLFLIDLKKKKQTQPKQWK